MKKYKGQVHFLFLFCCSFPAIIYAQSNYNSPRKNAFTFKLGQCLVNEINLGYEHFFTDKKSMELNGGLIYRNDFLRKQTEEWSNSQYFFERGFTARLSYKIYRNAVEKSGRKNYYSFGLNYQYLYYNNEWFDLGVVKTDSIHKIKNTNPPPDSINVTGDVSRDILQHRFRNRFGLQITLGNIFPIGNTFAIEIYYGIGLRGVLSNRFDVAVHENFSGTSDIYNQDNIYVSNNDDSKFYIRPTIHAGIKLRLGW